MWVCNGCVTPSEHSADCTPTFTASSISSGRHNSRTPRAGAAPGGAFVGSSGGSTRARRRRSLTSSSGRRVTAQSSGGSRRAALRGKDPRGPPGWAVGGGGAAGGGRPEGPRWSVGGFMAAVGSAWRPSFPCGGCVDRRTAACAPKTRRQPRGRPRIGPRLRLTEGPAARCGPHLSNAPQNAGILPPPNPPMTPPADRGTPPDTSRLLWVPRTPRDLPPLPAASESRSTRPTASLFPWRPARRK